MVYETSNSFRMFIYITKIIKARDTLDWLLLFIYISFCNCKRVFPLFFLSVSHHNCDLLKKNTRVQEVLTYLFLYLWFGRAKIVSKFVECLRGMIKNWRFRVYKTQNRKQPRSRLSFATLQPSQRFLNRNGVSFQNRWTKPTVHW